MELKFIFLLVKQCFYYRYLKRVYFFLLQYFISLKNLLRYGYLTFLTSLICSHSFADKSSISVLAPMNLIPAEMIEEFQKKNPDIYVHFDFVLKNTAYERNIQNKPFDVIIADTSVLETLSEKKMLLSIKRGVLKEIGLEGLLDTKVDQQKKITYYIPLLINPLGIIYKSSSLEEKSKIDWNEIINPKFNPLWRQRIKLNITSQEILSLSGVASKIEFDPLDHSPPVRILEWLKALKNQKSLSSLSILQALLTKNVAALVAYKDEFNALQNNLGDLIDFSIPESGTLYRKIGISILEKTLKPKVSSVFISYLTSRKVQIAKRTNLLLPKDVQSSWMAVDKTIYSQKMISKVDRVLSDD